MTTPDGRAAVLRVDHQGRPALIRVDHAALVGQDLVEIAGQQLAPDGTPHGRIWLTVPALDLPDALAGFAVCPAAVR